VLRDGLQTATEMNPESRPFPTLGRYRLIAELARGGMGVVYLALMRGPGAFSKLLVLKELKAELLGDPSVLAMFVDEARLAACLNHPNVVHTLEAGTDGDRHYIAMEYLDGQSLHCVISRSRKNGRPVPLAWQCAVLCSALEGLSYLHTAFDYDGKPLGIVHRDMTAHNVFVRYDGQVKVLDFGIAKALGSSVDTRNGTLKGKVAYMAPEQAAGAPVDARADIFAVGVVLWEAATGRRFWSGMDSDVQILQALSNGSLPTEHAMALAHVPPRLREVILKATAADPANRYASAAKLLRELRTTLAGLGGASLGPKDIGGLVVDLFAEDRARLQAAIDEALKASGGPVSGEFPVAEVARLDVEVDVPSLNMATRNTAPPSVPPVHPSTPKGQEVPAIVTTEDAREKLLSTAEEIEQATMRLQESERIATLPHSLETLVRAVRAVGGHESAVAIEALSNCMEVVHSYDQWRGSVVQHLRARPQPPPMLRNESMPPIEVEAARPARVDRRPLAFAAMLLIGGVAAGSAWGSLRHATRAVASPTPPATGSSALTPNPTVIAAQDLPRVENVRITIRASPVQSRIVIDQVACENPCVATLSKDGTSHIIHVEADGHLPQDHTFDANGDVLFVVALEPHAAPARPVTPTRGAAPTASSTLAESTGAAGFRSATAQPADPSVRHIIPANPYCR
jgi:serine/threonine protein kinase